MNGTICLDNNKCTACIEETGLRGEAKRELGNFKPLNLTLGTCNGCGLSGKHLGWEEKKKKIFPVQKSSEVRKNNQPQGRLTS